MGAHAAAPAAAAAVALPDDGATIPHPARPTKTRREKDASRHASMSFLTALSLSFSNLMAKFGRTFLTAFAGSIGIMGIAAILALSNGVNNYIDTVQENVLSSSPLTITESSFDITSIMTQAATYRSGADELEAASEDLIPESTIMSDVLTDVKNNDLVSFRAFLESGESGVEQHVNAITYNYGITPLIYAADTSNGVKQLNPSTLQNIMANGVSSLMSMGGGSAMGFQEMLDDQELLDEQYELVRGSWPQSYDECVLVLSESGALSDYTLYSLGVLDPDVLRDLLVDTINSENVDVPDAQIDFSYDDAMALHFKVVNACDLYVRSEDGSTWADHSNDDAFLASVVDDGWDLHVVGIVRPRETASSTSLGEGIAYRHELVLRLMADAANSEVVREQMDHPDVDIFTGRTFEELQDDQDAQLDMSSLFSVDSDRITSAFVIDESKMQMDGIDASAFDFSNLNLGDMSNMDIQIDEAAIAESVATTLATNVPAPDMSDMGFGDLANIDLNALASLDQSDPMALMGQLAAMGITPEILMRAQMAQAVGQAVATNYPLLLQGYIGYLSSQMSTNTEAAYAQAMQDYLAKPASEGGGADYLNAIVAAAATAGADEAQQEATRSSFTKYLVNTVAPNVYATLLGATVQATTQATEQATAQMQAQLRERLASAIAEQITRVMTSQMAGLASKIQSAISFDADVFASAIEVNMSQDDLTSLLTSYMNSEELTYDNNLTKLGYADEAKPRSVSIYAKSFEDKQQVEDIIAAYNARVEAEGNEDRSISYSDITGVLMGSVTDIINMISLVLIAFVSVSLVVSSIMIGIITYISVLERKKEIGILRAMGASKLNIANIFNAETFIEGLFAGLLAIGTILAVSLPINAMIEHDHNVQNIMALPLHEGAILILISVVLTFIAGLAPSMAAARRDPVEALRSE
jgi:ABC-type lipoprotein release transport system permease subunit